MESAFRFGVVTLVCKRAGLYCPLAPVFVVVYNTPQ